MSEKLCETSLNVYDAAIDWFSMIRYIFAEFKLTKTDVPDGI